MKKQKTPAENFSFEASRLAWIVLSEKFVRPGLSETEMLCYGLAGRKCRHQGNTLNINKLLNNINDSGAEGSIVNVKLLH